jgi:sugar (pentulose or hexulose) kinase
MLVEKSKATALTIDCGTQSIRALLFDLKGNLIKKVKKPFKPYFSVEAGWAEQEADFYYEKMCEACKELLADYDDISNVVGVSITTFRDTFVVLDKNLKPLRPAIVWLDQREASEYEPLPLDKEFQIQLVGMKRAVDSFMKSYKVNWIKQYEPEIWEKTYKYVMISTYLNYKLTDVLKDGVASQVGQIPLDFKKVCWAKGRNLKKYIFPIEDEKLAEIVKPGAKLGNVTKQASSETGIPEGLPVIASGSDKGCETYGNGCMNQNTASISLGSSTTIQTTMDRYKEIVKFIPPYPSVVSGLYNPEFQVRRGYWMVSWFKNEFAQKEVMLAKERNLEPEILLNEALKTIPPGSDGLLIQPYWGAELKRPEAKGAMIGFGAIHTRHHIYRAIVEGIGYALLDGLNMIESRNGNTIEEIAISGGGAQSDEICQISANMANRPIYRVQTHETSGLGAAMVLFTGMGYFKSPEDAVKNMVRKTDYFYPEAGEAEIYKELYEKVYKQMYGRLKPIYKNIYEIING